MRKLFLKKHAIYVIVLIIIQLIQLLFNYYELFNPSNSKPQSDEPEDTKQKENRSIV